MSRSGNVWNNAAAESFFSSSIKIERVKRNVYGTRDQARADVFDYIERFYNPTGCHSTIGYLSPMQYEERAMKDQVAAAKPAAQRPILSLKSLFFTHQIGAVKTAQILRSSPPLYDRLL